MENSVQIHAAATLSWKNIPRYPLNGGLDGLDALENRNLLLLSAIDSRLPGLTGSTLGTIPTAPPGLLDSLTL